MSIEVKNLIKTFGKNTVIDDNFMLEIEKHLKVGPAYYDIEEYTDQTMRQLVEETIREKALRLLNDEVPHGIYVETEKMKERTTKTGEPIYDVEILVPADYMGDVMSDLQGRRGLIMGMSSEGAIQRLSAKVPLAELANYSTSLSSITGSRASFTMKFASYELVPTNIQDELIAANKEDEA